MPDQAPHFETWLQRHGGEVHLRWQTGRCFAYLPGSGWIGRGESPDAAVADLRQRAGEALAIAQSAGLPPDLGLAARRDPHGAALLRFALRAGIVALAALLLAQPLAWTISSAIESSLRRDTDSPALGGAAPPASPQ